MQAHASPDKHQSFSSSYGWISPMGQMECLSPGESRMSFSMSSPPYHGSDEVETPISFVKLCDTLNSTISPSIFSPKDNRGLKLLKKRDFQRELMMHDNYLLLNDKNSHGESRVASEPVARPPLSVNTTSEMVSTKSHSLRNLKKNMSTPTTSARPVITPDTSFHGRSSAYSTQTRKSKHNIISPDVVLDGASKTMLPASPASVTCNCKKSKCLKLYCDCFATLNYCNANSCNCTDCANNTENEMLRQEAIKVTKDRNNFAFRTKISQKQEHAAGCRCKNSHCLKKYCECFTGNAFCGNNCKCLTCLNYSGSTSLEQARNNSGTMLVVKEKSPEKQPAMDPRMFVDQESQLLNCLSTLPYIGKTDFLGMLYDNKDGAEDADKGALVARSSSSSNGHSSSSSSGSSSASGGKGKKNRVKFMTVPLSYPFFGEQLPCTTKIISLKCLDYLDSKDIYSMAQVNTMWSVVAFDDALWE